MAKRGGHRAGAGRKPGSPNLIKAIDYFTPKDLNEFWADLRERAKTSDKIALYFAEQFTGKASQAVDHTSGGEQLKSLIYLPAKPDDGVETK